MTRYLLIFAIFLPFITPAQSTSRFKTVGSAVYVSDSCFRLTPAIPSLSGSVWYDTRIDLRQDFTLECEINLGGLDEIGADGVAFVMQPLSTDLGTQGQGLGYGGIDPSIAIEFDTWQNENDPPYDHIALVKNGIARHDAANTLVGPMEMLPGGANAEDRQNRPAKFIWDAANKRLKCYFDGQLKFDIAIDLINTVFKGNPYVYWGFTAATGGSFNDQRVCFYKYTFIEECPTAKINAKNPVCIGDTLLMKATGGKIFNWTGPNGFRSTDSTIRFINASTTLAGKYTVIASDSLCTDTADIDVVIKSRTVAGVDSVPLLCTGDSLVIKASGGISYAWSGPSNFSASTQNIIFPKAGTAQTGRYRVLVSNGACLDSAFVNVLVRPSPSVATKDTLVEPRSSLTLDLPSSADVSAWLWTPADQLSCTTCPRPLANLQREQSYVATVSNSLGCKATGRYNILFKCDVANIFIPSAFTPNGDGINDSFYPMGSGIRNVISMVVFDRWGQKIFERKNFKANDKSLGWDGRISSSQPGTGSYTYMIRIECSEGQIIDRRGMLTLIR